VEIDPANECAYANLFSIYLRKSKTEENIEKAKDNIFQMIEIFDNNLNFYQTRDDLYEV